MQELTEVLNQLKDIKDTGGLKTRPYVLFYEDKKIEFKTKDVITGRVADMIIELSKKYPMDLYDLMTVQLNEFVINDPEGKISEFITKYGYTTYQYTAYSESDKDLLNLLDSRKDIIKKRREVLYHNLIGLIEYKELNTDVWKSMNGKSKASKEFWENQDLEMLEEIYISFRKRIK